jgi:hypothetical protein
VDIHVEIAGPKLGLTEASSPSSSGAPTLGTLSAPGSNSFSVVSGAVYDATEFKPAVDFPVGIFSYASASDNGKGIAHMWAAGNALRLRGISTYCALMVRSGNWQEQWFGKPGAIMSLRANICPNALGNSCDRMYL